MNRILINNLNTVNIIFGFAFNQMKVDYPFTLFSDLYIDLLEKVLY